MNFRRTVRKLTSITKDEGLSGVISRVATRIERSRTPDAFDLAHGVETAREVSLFQLDIKNGDELASNGYQPSPAEVCKELLSTLPVEHGDFIFVDIGAGKGRVLLAASYFPFKRLLGVEFARELVDIARENMKRAGCVADVVHADARDYPYPDDNLLVYMFNPFNPEILRPVLFTLSRVAERREVYLVYLNPLHDSCVKEYGQELYQRAGAKVYRFERKKSWKAQTASR